MQSLVSVTIHCSMLNYISVREGVDTRAYFCVQNYLHHLEPVTRQGEVWRVGLQINIFSVHNSLHHVKHSTSRCGVSFGGGVAELHLVFTNHSIMLSLVLVYVKFGGWGCRAMFGVYKSKHHVKPSTTRC